MDPRGRHADWDDLSVNTRLQLFQMLRELEIPSFPTATNEELITIIESRLNPDDSAKKAAARQIYTNLDAKQRPKKQFYLSRLFFVAFLIFIFYILFTYFTSPLPYCSDNEDMKDEAGNVKCRKCPDNAVCGNKRAKCDKNSFLSAVGCRNKSKKRLYYAATQIANYISDRDGDCINSNPKLTLEQFSSMFSSFSPLIFINETGFGIVISDDNKTIYSIKPKIPRICRIISAIDDNPNVVGPIVILLTVQFIFYLMRKKHQNKINIAKQLAQEAHKILCTTDKQMFMYDMKVQLRAKYLNIDSIWKYVTRFIEEDSHVLVGVHGTRHEVYWKWIQ